MNDISTITNKLDETTIDGVRVVSPAAKDLLEFATVVNSDPNATDLYQLELQRNQMNVPSIETRNQSLNMNRSLQSTGKGPYQIAIRAERELLKRGLKTHYAELKTINPGIPNIEELQSMVDFLPNARFAYLNKVIKRALESYARKTGLLTPADLEFVKTIWINPNALASLTRLLAPAVRPNADGYSIEPVRSRSNVMLRDAPGIGTGQYISLKNPGNVYLPVSNQDNNEVDVEPMMKMIERFDRKISKIMDDIEVARDHADLFSYSKGSVQQSLVNMVDKINDKHLTYKDLSLLAVQINNFLGLRKSKYLLGLSEPWKHRTARIPTLVSVPSATFSVRSIVALTTNALGNVAFAFNPFFLCPVSAANSSFGVNNNAGLTGSAVSNFFLATAVGQELPANFYARYRVVSAGLRLYCYPSSNNDNGIAVISTTMEQAAFTSVGSPLPDFAQFGDFNQIENGYFKKTTTVASREVQEHLYIPPDQSFQEYIPLNNIKYGFAWAGYISGAAASSTIARVEIIVNYEAVLDNQYTDYLPSDIASEDLEPKNIPVILNKVKNLETLEPKNVKELLRQEDQLFNPEDIMELPTPPKKKKDLELRLKEETEDFTDMLKDFFPRVPKHKAPGILGNIMDIVSPVASGIIQHVASKYVPSIPIFNKSII